MITCCVSSPLQWLLNSRFSLWTCLILSVSGDETLYQPEYRIKTQDAVDICGIIENFLWNERKYTSKTPELKSSFGQNFVENDHLLCFFPTSMTPKLEVFTLIVILSVSGDETLYQTEYRIKTQDAMDICGIIPNFLWNERKYTSKTPELKTSIEQNFVENDHLLCLFPTSMTPKLEVFTLNLFNLICFWTWNPLPTWMQQKFGIQWIFVE